MPLLVFESCIIEIFPHVVIREMIRRTFILESPNTDPFGFVISKSSAPVWNCVDDVSTLEQRQKEDRK